MKIYVFIGTGKFPILVTEDLEIGEPFQDYPIQVWENGVCLQTTSYADLCFPPLIEANAKNQQTLNTL